MNWALFYINCGLAMAAGMTLTSNFVRACEEMTPRHEADHIIRAIVVLSMVGIVVVFWPLFAALTVLRWIIIGIR